MDAYTWTDADGDSAQLMAFCDFGGLDLPDDSALLLTARPEGPQEARVCIDTREQAENIIAWLQAHFGIE